MKLQTEACNFIKKETLTQVFSCKFYEISKNNFSYRTFLVAATVNKIFQTAKWLLLFAFDENNFVKELSLLSSFLKEEL